MSLNTDGLFLAPANPQLSKYDGVKLPPLVIPDGTGPWALRYIWVKHKTENDNFVKAYTKPVKEKKKVKVATSSNSQSSNTSSNDKIAQSKQICKDLGFKVNTEKFADCALKMMSMQFEVSNKVASSGGTKQEIIVKHKNDYDIWDALLDTSALLSNNNTSRYWTSICVPSPYPHWCFQSRQSVDEQNPAPPIQDPLHPPI